MKPLYKARFSIDQGPSLDQVIEVSGRWLKQRFEGELRGLKYGISSQSPGKFFESTRAKLDGEEYFAFRFTQVDNSNRDLLWRTEFGVKGRENEPKQIEIVMGNEWKIGSKIKPVNTELTRPALIPLLLDRFPARLDYPLSVKSKGVKIDNVKRFVDQIFNKKRVLPIIYASLANFNSKPRVNVEQMAFQLAGIAHVFAAEDIYHTYKLPDLIGKSMGCNDGAVRIYWPVGESRVNPSEHRSWTKLDIKAGDITKEILKTITEFTLGVPSAITFADVRRVALRSQIDTMKKRGDLGELAELYAQENDGLRQEVTSLRDQESAYIAQLTALNQRVGLLEDVLNNRKTGNIDEDKIPSRPVSSVREAVERFKEMYPAGTSSVEIYGKAFRGADDSLYHDPEQVFKVLEWLATAYLQSRKKGAKEDLRTSCKQQTGMDYNPHQSELTMGKWRSEYFITMVGKNHGDNINIPLEEHIGKGASKDPRETIRIAFHYDSKEGKIIVGYIGQHQRNRAT